MMSDKAKLWKQLVADHRLQQILFDKLAGWNFGNFVCTPEFDIISSMTKASQFGFHNVVDFKSMFFR